MIRILGQAAHLCDGVDRRELLRAGGLSLLGGLTVPRLLCARERSDGRGHGRARSVILFNLLGGPSHLDMFDLKPHAPAEIRGEFKPIATSLPGVQICEHLPNLARWMHRATLVRTFSHQFNSHDPLPILTGYTDNLPLAQAQANDPPDVGAVCQYLGLGSRDMPGAVCMPCYPGWGEAWRRRGPYGGFLGSQYDPLFTRCNPTFERQPRRDFYDPVLPIGEPLLPDLDAVPELTVSRFGQRRTLLQQLDAGLAHAEGTAPVRKLDSVRRRAFDMLTSGRVRAAFDLRHEPDRVRNRYGPSLTANCLLMARRLVEAGVPFVSVHQEIFGKMGHSYDMHENNFGMLKDFNLPLLDRCIPALLQDLDDRGLLESTLVIVMGEMGRTPQINSAAGRGHWPQCGFSLLIGGGVRSGHVHGETDRIAAYPVSHPVSPPEFIATVYELLGINPETTIPNRTGRPIPVAHGGRPVRGLLA
jgi:hypothetical protein